MGGTRVVHVAAGQTVDAGVISIQAPAVRFVYAMSAWLPGALVGGNYGTDWLFRAGLPQRSFTEGRVELGTLAGGFAGSYAGTLVGAHADGKVFFLDAATMKPAWAGALPDGAESGIDARGTWVGYLRYLTSGTVPGAMAPFPDVPALLRLDFPSATAKVWKKWPELAGKKIVDVTSSWGVVWFVLRDGEKADLWSWDPGSDTTRRLTSVGDLMGASDGGR
jgi:hypothetical protein